MGGVRPERRAFSRLWIFCDNSLFDVLFDYVAYLECLGESFVFMQDMKEIVLLRIL